MAEDTRAKPAEEQVPQAPVPSAEQKVPEPTKEQTVAPEEEATVAKGEPGEELELPKGASERTKEQFAKLKGQLKEYRERLFREQPFKEIKPTPTEEPEPYKAPVYDPRTGMINIDALEALESRAVQAETRAKRSEEAINRYIEGTQTREALSAHPELDPKGDKFDEKLHRNARAYLLDSMAYPDSYGGRTLTFKEAADLVKGGKPAPEVKPETPKEAAERLTPKEQASLEASGRPTPAVGRELSDEELERERLLTRLGDREAMTSRMSRIPEVPASRKK